MIASPDPADAAAQQPPHTLTDAVIAPGVRLLRSDSATLVRVADRVARLEGDGVAETIDALLALAEDGVVALSKLDGLSDDDIGPLTSVLDLLADAGLLVGTGEAPAVISASPLSRALWERSGRAVAPEVIEQNLRGAHLAVIGTHPLAERIVAALGDTGLSVETVTGELARFDNPISAAVVVGEHEDDIAFARWNDLALSARTPWWAVVPHDGRRAAVGPFVLPTASACWTCFRLRRAANYPDRSLVPELAAARVLPPAAVHTSLPGVELVQTGLLVEQVLDRVGLGRLGGAAVPGRVALVEVDGTGVHLSDHHVLRVPRCPDCSPAAGRGLPQVWYHGTATERPS